MNDADLWRELGQQLRVDSVRASAAAGSGHPTSSLSAADLAAVLVAKHLRYRFDRPAHHTNDRLVFSKGHASPLLYSILKAAGAITDEELLSFRKSGSRMQGHPTPQIPWVDVATGSLGQGLPIAVGIALAGKRLDRLPYRVWVLCGDSEMTEGSMWEAFEHAGFSGLDNLTAIVDVNRLGQRGETMRGWDTESYARRARAFGWHAIEIDGHDVEQIDRAYTEASSTDGKPTVIVARTLKGRGVSSVENKDGFHGKALDEAAAAVEELGGIRRISVDVRAPRRGRAPKTVSEPFVAPTYPVGSSVATRRGYGRRPRGPGSGPVERGRAGRRGEQFDLRRDLRRGLPRPVLRDVHRRAAHGRRRRWDAGPRLRPFASSFAAFLTRAYDFIRMAAVSRADVKLVGSHAGVSIGQDGPSQMGLEDIGRVPRRIREHGAVPVGPEPGGQAGRRNGGPERHRLHAHHPREYARDLRRADEQFAIGGSRLVRASDNDDVTIVAAGITLHEARIAADKLQAESISARVIDLYSVKPIDSKTLMSAAAATGAIVTVEDHWREGGIGDAVLDVFANQTVRPRVVKLAVKSMPGSGTPTEMLAAAGIDAYHIAEASRRVVAPRGRS